MRRAPHSRGRRSNKRLQLRELRLHLAPSGRSGYDVRSRTANTLGTDSASMNLKQLANCIGTEYRLRPLPLFVDADGTELEQEDRFWLLEDIPEEPVRLRLVCRETDHVVELQPDNVREYRSPDFLLLRCQLTARVGRRHRGAGLVGVLGGGLVSPDGAPGEP